MAIVAALPALQGPDLHRAPFAAQPFRTFACDVRWLLHASSATGTLNPGLRRVVRARRQLHDGDAALTLLLVASDRSGIETARRRGRLRRRC